MYKDTSSRTILLVDCDPAAGNTEKRLLEALGFDVVLATSAAEVTSAEHESISLVIAALDSPDCAALASLAGTVATSRELPLLFLADGEKDVLPEQVDPVESCGCLDRSSVPTIQRMTIHAVLSRFEKSRLQTNLTVEAEESMRTERKLFEDAAEILPLSFAIVSLDGKILFANRHALRLFEIETLDMMRETRVPLVWADPAKRDDWVKTLKEQGSIYNRETEMITLSGRRLWLLSSGMIVAYHGQTAILSIHNEITERKIAADLVRQSEQWFRSLADTTTTVIFIYLEDRYVYVNNSITAITGYSRREFLAFEHVWDLIHPDHREIARQNAEARRRGEPAPHNYELKILCKDGTARWLDVSLGTIEWEGRRATLGTAFDITDRHDALERGNRLLAENTLILKEAHHRIKNNMNLISALLSLEAESVAGTHCEQLLRDGAARAQSMMVLYDKLYRAGGVSHLSLDAFIPSLLEEVLSTFPATPSIETVLQIGAFEVDSRTLSTIGIIINELVTNSMKHAFVGRMTGTIGIEADRGNGAFTLAYHDDGVGLPETVVPSPGSTFGMQLIHLLVEQLKGEITITRDGGTRFTFRFPSMEEAAPAV